MLSLFTFLELYVYSIFRSAELREAISPSFFTSIQDKMGRYRNKTAPQKEVHLALPMYYLRDAANLVPAL